MQAGKFDIIPTMINVGSGLALLGVVSGKLILSGTGSFLLVRSIASAVLPYTLRLVPRLDTSRGERSLDIPSLGPSPWLGSSLIQEWRCLSSSAG